MEISKFFSTVLATTLGVVFFVSIQSTSWSQTSALDNVRKASETLSKIDATRLVSEDQDRMDLAKTKLEIALQQLSNEDPNLILIKDLRALQTLLGSLIISGHRTFGVKLKSNVSLTVDADLGKIIKKIFGQDIGVGGTLKINGADEVRAKYQSIRAEYSFVMGQAVAKKETDFYAAARGSMSWARSLGVFSQPECIDLFDDYKLC